MFCTHCGFSLAEPEPNFCPSCGKPSRVQEAYSASAYRKRLVRPYEGRKLAGVCAGIGDYLGLDPVLIRVLWVLAVLCVGGILAYLIAWIIIPNEPERATLVQPSRA
jgi:phage shock protein PspC (stress-responsive transcriptional regulator)